MDEDDFLEMVKDLQRKIEHEEESTYSQIVIREYRNPNNFGVLKNPDATGSIKGPCNDTMKITLSIKDGIIKDGRFWTDGCGATIACGNMLIKIIKNISLNDALKISYEKLLNILGGLPDEHHHCSKLAIDILRKSLKEYKNK